MVAYIPRYNVTAVMSSLCMHYTETQPETCNDDELFDGLLRVFLGNIHTITREVLCMCVK